MSDKPKASILIRTKNEERYLEAVLISVMEQIERDYEIVLIDDNSTDKTLEIANKYGCRVITIPKGKFSHPYSCNLGAQEAQGKYLLYINGHSIPVGKHWLESGLKNFNDEKVAGASSLTFPHKDGTFIEKLIYYFVALTIGNVRITNGLALHFFGTTNAIIRKDLWEKHPFDESLAERWGGEDWEWVKYWKGCGYKIISDPRFRARHSHHLTFKQMLWQCRNWFRMSSVSKKGASKQTKNF